MNLVGKLGIDMCSVDEFLLASSHPRVRAELVRTQQAAKGEQRNPQWPKVHAALLKSKGLSYADIKPSKELQANPWFQSKCRRDKECILYHMCTSGGNLTSIDASQRSDRCSKGYDCILHTLTPGMACWLAPPPNATKKQEQTSSRNLLGFEALALQGFPVDWLSGCESATDPQLSDLAGNAFAFPVFGAIYVSLLAHVPFKFPIRRHDDGTFARWHDGRHACCRGNASIVMQIRAKEVT